MIAERVEKPRTLCEACRDILCEPTLIHLEIDIPKRRSGVASSVCFIDRTVGGTAGRFGVFGLRTISGLPGPNYRSGGCR